MFEERRIVQILADLRRVPVSALLRNRLTVVKIFLFFRGESSSKPALRAGAPAYTAPAK